MELTQEEKNFKKRKEVIKSFAIVFLVILLILTFFSNTIMNHSLPEVSVQSIQAASITTKIRGTGNIESSDTYKVNVKETRTVSGVAVKVGDSVKKGDVLAYLSEAESTELATAEAALKLAQQNYEDALINADVYQSTIKGSQSGTSVDGYRKKIAAAQDALKNAQKEFDKTRETYNAWQVQSTLSGVLNSNYIEETQNAFNAAENLANATLAANEATNNTSDIANQLSLYKQMQDDAVAAQEEMNQAAVSNKKVEIGLEQAKLDNLKRYAALNKNIATVTNDDEKIRLNAEKESLVNTLVAQNVISTTDAATWKSATWDSEDASDIKSRIDIVNSKMVSLNAELKVLSDTNASFDAGADSGYGNTIAQLEQQLNAAKNEENYKTNVMNQAQIAATAAANALKEKENDGNIELMSVAIQTAEAAAEMSKAQNTVTYAKEELEKLVSDISLQLRLARLYEAITEAQEKVDQLATDGAAAEILAPIDGTISTILIASGKPTDPASPAFEILPTGASYSLSFTVPNEDAKMISMGMEAELVNSFWYSNVTARVSGIKPDPNSPNKNRLVVFDLQGDLTSGQSLTLSLNTRTANYDCVVPNSAIREDNNGKFVLKVISKSTPLGNRYIATRADVKVLSTDDKQSAIEGDIVGNEYVITTSTLPIKAGDQVRLAE